MGEFASKGAPKSKAESRLAREKRAPEPGREPPADRAFTYGRDLFLAAGQPRVQRKAEGEVVSDAEEREADAAAARATEAEAPAGLIVEDGQAPGPGQMARGAFLAALRAATTAAAAESLGPAWESGGCPYLEAWFDRHQGDDAATLERLTRRYAGTAGTAAEYISAACKRLREGIAAWSAGAALGGHLEAAGLGGEAGPGSPGAVMAKEAPGARFAEPGSPAAVVARLGSGAPLDAGAAARLGGALGEDFGGVRLAGELGATAFTVGRQIAFAAGEYRPGTLAGDALLAHELAHVAQQRSASADGAALRRAPVDLPAHEDDADRAAVGTLARLYRAGSAAARALNVRPALRTDLSLQRCRGKKKPPPKKGYKILAKGTMTWTLESPFEEGEGQLVNVQIAFTPKAQFRGKTTTFLQTVRKGGPESIASKKPRVDILRGQYGPFYGAQWNAEEGKWTGEAAEPGYKSAPSTAEDPTAYLFDQPMVYPGEVPRRPPSARHAAAEVLGG